MATYLFLFQPPEVPRLNTATSALKLEKKVKECANTFQGRVWITDDKGALALFTLFLVESQHFSFLVSQGPNF